MEELKWRWFVRCYNCFLHYIQSSIKWHILLAKYFFKTVLIWYCIRLTEDWLYLIRGKRLQSTFRVYIGLEKILKYNFYSTVTSNCGLAAEALAALASKEDFSNVALKSATSAAPAHGTRPVMLLQVKGRRRVQVTFVCVYVCLCVSFSL